MILVLLFRSPISAKHLAFVIEYMDCWNATEAYARIYPKAERESARRLGSQLLSKVDVWGEIQRRMAVRAMGPEEVLARLSDQARANQLPFIRITEDGFCYFDFSNPDAKNYFHLIKKIRTKRQRRLSGGGDEPEEWEDEWVEVELYDAQAALTLLGRHHKLFTDNVDIRSDGQPINKITDEERLAQMRALGETIFELSKKKNGG